MAYAQACSRTRAHRRYARLNLIRRKPLRFLLPECAFAGPVQTVGESGRSAAASGTPPMPGRTENSTLEWASAQGLPHGHFSAMPMVIVEDRERRGPRAVSNRACRHLTCWWHGLTGGGAIPAVLPDGQSTAKQCRRRAGSEHWRERSGSEDAPSVKPERWQVVQPKPILARWGST